MTTAQRNVGYSQIWPATRTIMKAFANDPAFTYAGENYSPADSFIRVWLKFLIRAIIVFVSAQFHVALQIEDCSSICLVDLPESGNPYARTIAYRVTIRIRNASLKILRALLHDEEILKRRKEFERKMEACSRHAIGDKKSDMLYLSFLATDPNCQRKGYASKLVRAINEMADSQGRDVWLVSSTPDNTPFYNAQGYVTLSNIILGDDDPARAAKSVILPLMVRRTQRASEK